MSKEPKTAKPKSSKSSTEPASTEPAAPIDEPFSSDPKSSDTKSYMDEASKPIADRSDLPVGRNGNMVAPRRYAHSDDKIAEKKAAAVAAGAKFVNPLDRKGQYWASIETLCELGVDTWHSHPEYYKRMRSIMESHMNNKKATLWDKFATREERPGASSPKDVHGRIQQNARVLQRLGGKHQYGYKLTQFCMSMDIHLEPKDGEADRDSKAFPLANTWYYRLNTTHASPDSVKPLYENKQPRKGRVKKEVENKPDTSDSD